MAVLKLLESDDLKMILYIYAGNQLNEISIEAVNNIQPKDRGKNVFQPSSINWSYL